MAITYSISTQAQTDGNAFSLQSVNPTFSSEPTLLNASKNTLFKSNLAIGDQTTTIYGFKQNDNNDFQVRGKVNGEVRALNQDETVYKYYLTKVNDNLIDMNMITNNSDIPSEGILIGRSNVLINKSVVKSSSIWFNNPDANQHSPYDPVYFIPLFGVYRNHKTAGNENYYTYGLGVDTEGTFAFKQVLQGGYTNARYNANNALNLNDTSARFIAKLINTADLSEDLVTLTDRVNKIDLDIIEINKKLASLPQDIAGYVAAAASEVSKLYVAR